MGVSWGSKPWLFTGMFLKNLNSVYKTLQAEPTNRKNLNEQGWKTECHARGVLLKNLLEKYLNQRKLSLPLPVALAFASLYSFTVLWNSAILDAF